MTATPSGSSGSRALMVGALLLAVGGGARLADHELGRRADRGQIAALHSELAGRLAGQEEAEALAERREQLERESLERARALTDAQAELARVDAALAELEQRRQKEHDALERALSESQQAVSESQQAVSESQQALASHEQATQKQLAQLRATKREAEALAQERAAALLRMEETLREARDELVKSTERLAAQQAEAAELREAVVQRQRALETSKARVEHVEELLSNERHRAQTSEQLLASLRAAGVNVDRLAGIDPMPNLRGRVVKVDTSVSPIELLVDLGGREGVQLGDALYVVRDGREVGRLEVADVRERICAARLVRGQRGLSLRPGDVVVSLPPER